MILKVLSSNSKGNGYLLISSEGEALAIEAGCPFVDLLRAVDYDRSRISGCAISHCHSDHASHAEEYHNNGILLFSHEGIPHVDYILKERRPQSIGSFSVTPFSVEHDVPNYGYIIKHPEMGRMLFATDCAYIPTIFKGVDNFLIEANYSEEKLLLSDTDNAQKKRIMKAHMSLEYCVDYLRSAEAENAKNIILIHLSSRHSDATSFLDRVEGEFGVPTFIAHKDSVIHL